MNLVRLTMEFILVALAVIGGWTVAGWVGVVVTATFFVTLIVETTLKMRSPRARVLRQIAREMVRPIDGHPNVQRAVLIHDDHIHVLAVETEPAPSTDGE